MVTVMISRASAWGANGVVLELDDYVSLSGQALDFSELDGSIDTAGYRRCDG